MSQQHHWTTKIEDLARQPEDLTVEQAEAAHGGSILLIKTLADSHREGHLQPNS
jgi:hypothetical protein